MLTSTAAAAGTTTTTIAVGAVFSPMHFATVKARLRRRLACVVQIPRTMSPVGEPTIQKAFTHDSVTGIEDVRRKSRMGHESRGGIVCDVYVLSDDNITKHSNKVFQNLVAEIRCLLCEIVLVSHFCNWDQLIKERNKEGDLRFVRQNTNGRSRVPLGRGWCVVFASDYVCWKVRY